MRGNIDLAEASDQAYRKPPLHPIFPIQYTYIPLCPGFVTVFNGPFNE